MKTLIILEIIGEDTYKYIIDLTGEQFNKYKQLDGIFIGLNDEQGHTHLFDELCDFIKSHNCKNIDSISEIIGIDRVIHTGFAL